MPDRDVAGQFFDVVFGTYLSDESHTAVAIELLPVARRNPRAFLAAMLECEKAKEGEPRDFEPFSIDSEDRAFLSNICHEARSIAKNAFIFQLSVWIHFSNLLG
jgi:hypothetical protein